MSSQQSKRQRTAAQNSATLRRLAHTGNVTIRGLVDLIGTLRDDPEALVSKFRVEEAILEPFRQIRHTETLPLHDGTTFDWEFCDPNLLLAKVVAESPALAALYADAANKHPCSAEDPWSLVIGFDEFTPGNKLAIDNKRKIMNLSFTFLQLGSAIFNLFVEASKQGIQHRLKPTMTVRTTEPNQGLTHQRRLRPCSGRC